ncbi:MAG: preprotein translocase subunit SecE [Anaerolineae bacterium]|nr:preprotein translocase subunit SecE [Anaerolineae bacterium]
MVKKDEKSSSGKRPNFIQRYFSETIGELRKVTWPTRREALNLPLIGLAVTLSVGVFLGLLDYLFSRFFAMLFA